MEGTHILVRKHLRLMEAKVICGGKSNTGPVPLIPPLTRPMGSKWACGGHPFHLAFHTGSHLPISSDIYRNRACAGQDGAPWSGLRVPVSLLAPSCPSLPLSLPSCGGLASLKGFGFGGHLYKDLHKSSELNWPERMD
jgi:hypothetical protein